MLNELIIIGTLVSNCTITAYRSVAAQTDDSPFFTSTGERVHAGGVAVSRDLLCGACRKLHHQCKHPEDGRHLHYGQWLYIPKYGFLQVFDVMNYRKWDKKTKKWYPIKNAIDLWVPNYKAERGVGMSIQPVYKVEINNAV